MGEEVRKVLTCVLECCHGNTLASHLAQDIAEAQKEEYTENGEGAGYSDSKYHPQLLLVSWVCVVGVVCGVCGCVLCVCVWCVWCVCGCVVCVVCVWCVCGMWCVCGVCGVCVCVVCVWRLHVHGSCNHLSNIQ